MRLHPRPEKGVLTFVQSYGVVVKAIIEVFFLNEENLRIAGKIAEKAGVGFIKTSTGTKPDTVPHVENAIRILRTVLEPETVVKASGGCYTLGAILLYYNAGARRFGASETATILCDYEQLLSSAESSKQEAVGHYLSLQ